MIDILTTSSALLITVEPDTKARSKAVAKRRISVGSSIVSMSALASALLEEEKGRRCDQCLRASTSLKKCSGCGSYWYCDTTCQNNHWQSSHKRLCKKITQFIHSVTFQQLEKHERMDSLLLTHLLAHLSTLPEPYAVNHSKELAIMLDLLPGPAEVDTPRHCILKPGPPSQKLVDNLYARFGNNNFTIHSHLNSIAHGVFPLASRLFNHSCVPNAVARYLFRPGEAVTMEVVSLRDLEAGEELSASVCIPYIDPALMQTRQQVFQLTYGFTCCCTSCKFLEKIGSIPIGGPELEKPLRDFIGVDNYLKTGSLSEKTVEQLPPSLYPVLNEAFMTNLSERFSKASHEGDYDEAARSGITLLALYLLVYPRNYPQIGMHLLEMAKTQWNHSFVTTTPTSTEDAKNVVLQLLTLARGVLQVLGSEGPSDTGPFAEISMLERLLQNA